ncbi:protein Wnt-1-like [Ctenocephalides felis]|uniref:protein Wnt-1-like n=1 Tax=Ctenocephalides felis TaxID=7515 RepID=UPI000E6E1A6E|nr:protein Wnt-1-like [Ctenocephalides felis]
MILLHKHRCRTNIYFVLNMVLSLLHDTSANWWRLGRSEMFQNSISSWNFIENCNSLKFLNEKQQDICLWNNKMLSIISLGAQLGIEECQHQFRNNRWNCSLAEEDHSIDYLSKERSNIFGHVLDINSRESAYVHAITSASIAYAVTRACSKGELNECACDRKIRNKARKWQWGGCSDDINFGERFSRDFVDSIEDTSTVSGLMNLHNNEAGRRAVRSRMSRACKCHGVSGSCSVRVCWRRLPPLREVGSNLGLRYDGASHVKLAIGNGRKRKRKLKPIKLDMKKPSKTDLVYLEDSPDYCERNESLSVLGTHGRTCDQASQGLDGCRLLCCGRGYQTRLRLVTEKCQCQFVWCCDVICQQCSKTVEEHVCN